MQRKRDVDPNKKVEEDSETLKGVTLASSLVVRTFHLRKSHLRDIWSHLVGQEMAIAMQTTSSFPRQQVQCQSLLVG